MTPLPEPKASRACPTPSSRRCWRAGGQGRRGRALDDVGLGGKEAALDIHDLRSLVECIQLVRRTAVQTAVRVDHHRRAGRAPRGHRHEAEGLRRRPVAARHPKPSAHPHPPAVARITAGSPCWR